MTVLISKNYEFQKTNVLIIFYLRKFSDGLKLFKFIDFYVKKNKFMINISFNTITFS